MLELLTDVVPAEWRDTAEASERVQAAVLLLADGHGERFLDAAALGQRDWRDVLVAAQLAGGDWADRLNPALGDRTT